MAEKTCENCKYRKGKNCKRYAPQPTVGKCPNTGCTSTTGDIRWPVVDLDGWCGEYMPEGA
ncbi:MAG: hypothetical protein ACYTBJ_02165 [Planctomycetota bacterium]|jgi:hypothetical protein